ncbi:photosynthetic complex assembly protein PuhC [Aquibium sp. ELW1220]|jgi:putative photosynthetic complex assembly protein|uniref:photosynthetic complex assembly protein PuhC n=1 Tax=Aquibium sp. ELW1220 TaxID=2976766 RepID=UPI0025B06615|nr:photosynthetic complex assembly protein PuhC [Aquibium sp. ELW1220]MDN2581081.1 photosynthetic complex assembly protein PuhC [Aquibium sp. ELW1220]
MTQAIRQPDPLRRPAIACGALAMMGILIAALSPKSEAPMPAGPAEVTLPIRFTDAPGGIVVVSDATTGDQLARLGVGEGGFVRTTVRGLAMARKKRGISDATPFELVRYPDGALRLVDPETGRTITLNAFGQPNAAAFGAFIDQRREPI